MVEEKNLKESKYSNKGPIDLDSIPIADTNLAIMEFGEGSISLTKCLRAMWMRGLKTHSCNAKCEEPYNIAHITMKENIDLFSFLSPVILEDEMVQIDIVEDRQTIRFAGTKARIEGAILSLIRDIQSGRKKNRKQLEEKIGVPFPEEWLQEYETYKNKNNGTSKKLAS